MHARGDARGVGAHTTHGEAVAVAEIGEAHRAASLREGSDAKVAIFCCRN